jgi:hypothetical protein
MNSTPSLFIPFKKDSPTGLSNYSIGLPLCAIYLIRYTIIFFYLHIYIYYYPGTRAIAITLSQ